MTLPTIVIASRSAIKSVPPSIEEASIGLGSSKVQTIFNFTLPLAMPGILTGTIIGIARAIGETAPLLMIGMVAFIVDIPQGPLDASTALPVQIFLWQDSPERAFVERTSAAIIVLLIFLFLLNITAVYLRKKLEKNGDIEFMSESLKIAVKNLNVFYGKKQALFDINLNIFSNEVTSLIGPSGCGKSTLIKCFNR